MPQDEFRDLAKAFLDLWQDQLSASFRDPDVMARNMQMMQSYAQAYFEAMQQGGGSGNQQAAAPFAGWGMPPARREEKSGYTSVTADVSHGGHELSHFHQRLEALERRLTLLEVALGNAAKPAKPKPKPARQKAAPRARKRN